MGRDAQGRRSVDLQGPRRRPAAHAVPRGIGFKFKKRNTAHRSQPVSIFHSKFAAAASPAAVTVHRCAARPTGGEEENLVKIMFYRLEPARSFPAAKPDNYLQMSLSARLCAQDEMGLEEGTVK